MDQLNAVANVSPSLCLQQIPHIALMPLKSLHLSNCFDTHYFERPPGDFRTWPDYPANPSLEPHAGAGRLSSNVEVVEKPKMQKLALYESIGYRAFFIKKWVFLQPRWADETV